MSEYIPNPRHQDDRRHPKGRRITELVPGGQTISASALASSAKSGSAWLMSSAPGLLKALAEADLQLGDVAPYWSSEEYEQRIWRVGQIVRDALDKAKHDEPVSQHHHGVQEKPSWTTRTGQRTRPR